ncbi:MAG: hypothetical protein VX519_03515 [Myxococcota bacterium]|nr:hypothetical protein [Myxococcota bacterium]
MTAAIVGGGLGPWLFSGLEPARPLESDAWQVVAPALGVSAEYRDDRGTVLIGRALTLGSRDIRRPDRLSLRAPGEPGWVSVALASDSREVSVQFRDAQTRLRRDHLLVDGAGLGLSGDAWIEGDGSGIWVLRRDQDAWKADTPQGVFKLASRSGGGDSTGLELSSGYAGLGRISEVVVKDTQGAVLAETDFTHGPTPWWSILSGVFLGGVIGALSVGVAWVGVAPLLGALAVSATTWVAWADRLVLVGVSGAQLGRWVVAAACVLPLWGLMVRWGPRHGGQARPGRGLWLGATVIAAGLATRGELGNAWGMALGVAWLLAPAWFLRRAGLDEVRGVGVEAPGFLAVAILGWSQGFLLSALWRAGVVFASVSNLRKGHARVGADFALLALLGCPVGLELAVRSGPVNDWWDAAVLRGESEDKGEDWRQAKPSWSGACGPSNGGDTLRMAYAGGSATGGAFEFARHPEWFFPVQAQERLCGETLRVETWNYGNTHRDTHTISRTVDSMLEESDADILVLYVGMNDLLTAEHPQTRAEREQAVQERSSIERVLRTWSNQSRVVTGLALAIRNRGEAGAMSRVASVGVTGGQRRVQGYPSGVPVEDARINLERIAQACASRNVSLVLLSQILSRDERVLSSLDRRKYFDPYWEMELALADELDHVYFFDAASLQRSYSDEEMLLDMNHMTRSGNALLGEFVVSELKSSDLILQ